MQVAINPSLYDTAQENVTDVVLSLLGAGAPVAKEDINGREAYYKHLEEKYQRRSWRSWRYRQDRQLRQCKFFSDFLAVFLPPDS